MEFSEEKTLGSVSPNQFARTVALIDELDSVSDVYALLKQKPRFKRLVESPRIGFFWSWVYELPYVQVLALLIIGMADQAELAALKAAEDKTEFLIRQAETADELPEIGRVKASRILPILALQMALAKSAESFSLYSVSMNELVERVGKGDREAMLRAIRVDPTVLSAPTVAHQFSLAVMKRDKRFIQRVKKALDGPHKGLYPYKKLRYSAVILEEAGALVAGNREHVFDVVANKLKLYDQRQGDPFKGLFTQFARWKQHAST